MADDGILKKEVISCELKHVAECLPVDAPDLEGFGGASLLRLYGNLYSSIKTSAAV